uniref:hypothetical protein n=1 Tax=Clostridium butyricum TaxID=1492 RepID=UPI00374E856F
QLNDFNRYYCQIFIESKKKSNLNFWEEYFDFLNCLLNTVINNKNILEYINKFWNDKYQYNEKNNVDNNKLIIYLRYIYYFYQNQEQYVNEKHLEKLKYVLDNLKYDEWKQKKLQTTELLAKHSSRYKDVFEYFSKRESNEVIGDLGLVKYNCEINDIKFRVKEQSIKSKIIAKIKENPEKFENPNVDYNFFECVEKKSEKRQIQYIFQISDMWEKEITIEKIEKLLKYIRVAKIFFCDINNRLLWRKLFAIATCWNEREDRLLNSEDINKKTNDRYINEKNNKPIDNNNIYYWKDDYYFIWDDMKEKANDSYIIRGKKKNIIKIAYEICTKNKLYEEKERREWLINQFNESYNNCWLKYAVDRDYDELLIKNISYNEISGILYINVKYFDEYGEHQKKANFFGMIYILDKDKNEWSSNLYYTSVWDYDSKRINSYVKENGISVNSLRNSKKIINQFGLRLLWNSCYEKKFSYEANGIRTIERYFFYYIQSYDFFNEENSVIAIDNGKVIITNFGGNNLYTQLKYDFGNSIEKANVEGNIDICINEIRKYKQLSDIDNNKWKEYSYNYNNQSIHKCSFKNVINSSIGKALFDSVNAGQGQVLEFRKLK